jgi:hypothetical protein
MTVKVMPIIASGTFVRQHQEGVDFQADEAVPRPYSDFRGISVRRVGDAGLCIQEFDKFIYCQASIPDNAAQCDMTTSLTNKIKARFG